MNLSSLSHVSGREAVYLRWSSESTNMLCLGLTCCLVVLAIVETSVMYHTPQPAHRLLADTNDGQVLPRLAMKELKQDPSLATMFLFPPRWISSNTFLRLSLAQFIQQRLEYRTPVCTGFSWRTPAIALYSSMCSISTPQLILSRSEILLNISRS